MDIQKKIESLGLSERESRVYVVLLDVGPTTASKIIRKTGIASSKIYDVMEKLIHKGLVTYVVKHGKKEFHPADPQRLLDIIKEKEVIIKEILPTLEELFKKTAEEIVAEIYTGKDGIRCIFEDILKEEKDWQALGASGKAAFTLPYFMPHFYRRMKDKKIKLQILFVDNDKTRKQAEEFKDYNNVSIKFLPKMIDNLMVIFIYANKVVIIPITPTVEMTPIAVLIKSKESAESYRKYFKWLWTLCR